MFLRATALMLLAMVLALPAPPAMAPFSAPAQDSRSAVAKPEPRQAIAAAPRSWSQHYNLDAAGKPTGFAIAAMKAFAVFAGVRVTCPIKDDFASVETALTTGDASLIPNYGISADCRAVADFTRPIETIAISIIVRRDARDINDIEDLSGMRVGAIEADLGAAFFLRHPDTTANPRQPPKETLFELPLSYTEAVIFPGSVMLHLDRNAGTENQIAVIEKPWLEVKRALAVRKDAPPFLAAFGNAAKQFVGAPDYRRIYAKSHGKRPPYWTNQRVGFFLGGALVGLALVFAIWRYRLLAATNRRLAASEETFRDLVEGAVPGVLIHRNHKPLFVNQAYARILGYDNPGELLRQPSALDHAAPHERRRLAEYSEARHKRLRAPEVYTFQGIRKDGTPILLENRGRIVEWEGAPAVQLTVADVTDRKLAEEELLRRSMQQAVLAEIAQHALSGRDLMALENTAAELTSKFLGVDFCKIMELLPGGDDLLLRAGVGWKSGVVGVSTVSADKSSQVGHSLRTREPVVVEDIALDKRFAAPPPLRDHGVVSSMSVVIGEVAKPYGVISVYAKTRRAFSEDDAMFLKTVAILLATAVSRRRAENELATSEKRLRGAIESLQEGFALYDADDRLVVYNEQYLLLNPHAEEIMARGGTFEEALRINIRKGKIPDAVGREEEFIKDRIRRHRDPKGPIVIGTDDGATYLIKESRTEDGGTAVTVSDISELKQAEDALRDSRETIRAVVDASPSGIVLKNKDGRYLLVNKTYASWMNRPPEDIVGKNIFELLPESADAIMNAERPIYRTGEVATIEYEVRYGDGLARDVISIKGPVHSKNGDIVAVCTVVTDVTEARRKDRALRETQNRFKIVVNNLPMGVSLKDREGRFVLVNKRYQEWWGKTETEMLGRRTEEITPHRKASIRARNAQEREVREKKKVTSCQETVTLVDGKSHEIEHTKFPVLDPDGEVALIGTITADITDRQRTERRLADLQSELAHVLRVSTMSEMAAGLAHELNQPLAAINNYAWGTLRRLRADGGQAPDLLNILDLIVGQALRAGDIIRKMRGFMRRSGPHVAPIDPRAVIDEVVPLFGAGMQIEGIDIAIAVPESLPPAMADSVQVQQVLLNLICNAVSAMRAAGQGPHRLEIGAVNDTHGSVEIYVKDNGPGMAPDVADQIFKPFFTTKADGLGMGLSISRAIIADHEGRMWVTSAPGQGATFHFTLPIEQGKS